MTSGRKERYEEWRKDPAKVRAHNDRVIRYRTKLKAEVITHYGGRCSCCGESRPVFLTIDHIEGGGNEHRRALQKTPQKGHPSGGRCTYVWLRNNNYPEGFQVLCWNCNSAKHILGVCPHQECV